MSRQARLHEIVRGLARRSRAIHRYAHNKRSQDRPLRLEALEDRRVLAAVTVGNLVDVVNGNVTSTAALIASPGADGISLREAILAANATAEADTIDFAPSLTSGGPKVIKLMQGELFIDTRMTIQGPLAGLLTIDAAGNDNTEFEDNGDGSRIFRIERTITITPIAVSISGLRLAGGDIGPTDHGGSGGGIWNNQNLTLSGVEIVDNSATYRGGGVHHESSQTGFTTKLTVVNSTILGNRGGGFGGGLLINGAGEITNSMVINNTAGDGGGLFFVTTFTPTSTMIIVDSSFTQNTALTGKGGGAFYNGGLASISGSTVSSNSAPVDGGGVYATNFSEVWLTQSTISGNSCSGRGGGVYCTGSVTLMGSTVSGNSASLGGGGGIYAGGNVSLTESTVSGNSTAGNNPPPKAAVAAGFVLKAA